MPNKSRRFASGLPFVTGFAARHLLKRCVTKSSVCARGGGPGQSYPLMSGELRLRQRRPSREVDAEIDRAQLAMKRGPALLLRVGGAVS